MRHLLLAITTLGMALSAQAVEREPISSKFSYSKQQLQSEHGAKQVLTKLTKSMRKACRVDHEYRKMVRGRIDRKCVDQMMADAVSTIDAPTLNAVYRQRIDKR
jgi:UrcA family protein